MFADSSDSKIAFFLSVIIRCKIPLIANVSVLKLRLAEYPILKNLLRTFRTIAICFFTFFRSPRNPGIAISSA